MLNHPELIGKQCRVSLTFWGSVVNRTCWYAGFALGPADGGILLELPLRPLCDPIMTIGRHPRLADRASMAAELA